MPIDSILSIINTGIGLLQNEPTPEEQRAKAGVWYSMLDSWVNDQPQTSIAFGDRWENLLPFSSKSTKKRFIENNIDNKSDSQIKRVLIDKINDELVKGGFTRMTDSSVLSGIGGGSNVLDSSDSLSSTNPLETQTLSDLSTPDEISEGKTFFYIMAIVASAVLVLFLAFTPGKKRRR